VLVLVLVLADASVGVRNLLAPDLLIAEFTNIGGASATESIRRGRSVSKKPRMA
jgi:hypothetical protein